MAYTNQRISAWIDDQLGPDNRAIDQGLIWDDIPRQPPQQSIKSEPDGFGISNNSSVYHQSFEQILEDFKEKRNTPLIRGFSQKCSALYYRKKLGNQRQAMRPVKVTHFLNSRRLEAEEQIDLLNLKILFHVSRTNFLSTSVIRSIIASKIASNTPEYALQHNNIKAVEEDCFHTAFQYVVSAVDWIVEEVNLRCGEEFFQGLGREDRNQIFRAIFRQSPAWIMSQYRARESEYVDFREIFAAAVRRRDLEQKKKWRAFFEYGFVLFCDKVFKCLEGGAGEELQDMVKESWLWMDERERVRVLGVGGAFDLPAAPGTALEKKPTSCVIRKEEVERRSLNAGRNHMTE